VTRRGAAGRSGLPRFPQPYVAGISLPRERFRAILGGLPQMARSVSLLCCRTVFGRSSPSGRAPSLRS
jgi:hypothetical protein